MKFFSKQETKMIISIFVFLFTVTILNINVSLRKGRDATRKNDLSTMQKAIDIFYQKYHEFPKSIGGKIIGCFKDEPKFDKVTGKVSNAVPCEWGVSSFENISVMTKDPKFDKGFNYLYISNGEKYELYVSLEGEKEAEYSKSVVKKNLQCGSEICNYGRWSD